MTLTKLMTTIRGEVHRRKKKKSSHQNNVRLPNTSMAAGHSDPSAGPSNGRIAKNKKPRNDRCYVFGKLGHFAKECWHRQDGSLPIERFFSPSRGRGRARGRGPNHRRHRYFPRRGFRRGRPFLTPHFNPDNHFSSNMQSQTHNNSFCSKIKHVASSVTPATKYSR